MSELKGQARRGAERRTAIVDAAIEVFAKRGFRGGALAEVAERVGLSAAGILYHFGSKEELLRAVIAERDRRDIAQVDLPVQGGLESIRGLVQFAEASERRRGVTMLHSVLLVESFEQDAPTHEFFVQRSKNVRRALERTLRAAQRKGEVLPDVDCKAKAREIVAFMEGAATVWLLDESVSLVDLYRGYLESLTRAIGTTLNDRSD